MAPNPIKKKKICKRKTKRTWAYNTFNVYYNLKLIVNGDFCSINQIQQQQEDEEKTKQSSFSSRNSQAHEYKQ